MSKITRKRAGELVSQLDEDLDDAMRPHEDGCRCGDCCLYEEEDLFDGKEDQKDGE